jgi:hypothetical protein
MNMMTAVTRPAARAVAFGAVLLALSVAPAVAQQSPERNAYFGELHIHSGWSIDAYVFGTRLGPEAEIKYALGEPVMHPGGFKVQLKQPLDFTVVMDHSEYLGVLAMADDPNSPLRQSSPLTANLLRFGTWANGTPISTSSYR